MVRQQDRLRALQVGVTRQIRIPSIVSATIQHIDETEHAVCGGSELALDKQSQGGNRLIVTTATRVQLGASCAGNFGYASFDRCVNVFIARHELKRVGLHFGLHLA